MIWSLTARPLVAIPESDTSRSLLESEMSLATCSVSPLLSVPETAVMVDASEADGLVRQMPQLVDRRVYFDSPGCNGIEKCAEALLFDGTGSLWRAHP